MSVDKLHTVINTAIPYPLALGRCNTSAKIPGAIATGALPKMPVRSLNIRNDAQFGAIAHAIVNRVKTAKVAVII